MAIISVEVPENIANRFKPFTVIKFKDLENIKIQYELQSLDWEWWENSVDFWSWVLASEVLSSLKKDK